VNTRVAVMTDVHGNIHALRAALNDIDEQRVERIYCLGDMISIGPFTNEVLEALTSRRDVSMLIGNHEQAILALLDGNDPGSPGTERLHHEWVASRIDPSYVPLLRRLPPMLEAEHGSRRLLLLHYHHDREGRLVPYDREPTLKKLETMYSEQDADAVCFGHHHPVHYFRSARRVYVNPGSLGCAYEPVARYALLDCAPDGVRVQLRAVVYDNREFLASYHHLSVPAGDFILKLFHGDQHLASG